MKWAICQPNGPYKWVYWNGQFFVHEKEQAVLFFSKALADKVMYRVWDEEPEDEDDWAFLRSLKVRQV